MDDVLDYCIIGHNCGVPIIGIKVKDALILSSTEGQGEALPYYDLKNLRKSLNGEVLQEVYVTKGIKVAPGDVVISGKGTVGDVFVISKACYLISSFYKINQKYNLFLPEYLKLWFESKRKEIVKSATGLIPSLNKNILGNMVIPLKTKEEQSLIVSALSKQKGEMLDEINQISKFYEQERNYIFDKLMRKGENK